MMRKEFVWNVIRLTQDAKPVREALHISAACRERKMVAFRPQRREEVGSDLPQCVVFGRLRRRLIFPPWYARPARRHKDPSDLQLEFGLRARGVDNPNGRGIRRPQPLAREIQIAECGGQANPTWAYPKATFEAVEQGGKLNTA